MSTPQTWQIVIQKQYAGEYWVNDYHVQANSPTDARIKGAEIVEIERDIHRTNVSFVNYRVRAEPSSDQGTVYPLGLSGTVQAGVYLGLFNVLRVDMACELGRPGRKYLRLPITTDGVQNGQFVQAALDAWTQLYCIPLQNLGYVCKPNGQLFTIIRPNPVAAMRQLRRGSKRKLQPII